MERRKPEVPIDTIERRLERLERASRRWKAVTTLATADLESGPPHRGREKW